MTHKFSLKLFPLRILMLWLHNIRIRNGIYLHIILLLLLPCHAKIPNKTCVRAFAAMCVRLRVEFYMYISTFKRYDTVRLSAYTHRMNWNVLSVRTKRNI